MKWRGVEIGALEDAELKSAHDTACAIISELADEMQRRGMWAAKKRKRNDQRSE